MKLLSIETSCDDTCISIFEVKGGATQASFKVLANVSNSQINIHIPYGGVYPVLAKREHAKNLPILLEEALKLISKTHQGETLMCSPVDAIAVTYGPGLEMCLWEGILFAKNLAKKWDIPVIPVNHMEGHILSVFGKNKGSFKIPKVETPALSLLVSGGHTQLVLIKKPTRTAIPRQNDLVGLESDGWMKYEIIGETLDDAVGEAFDKVARMLELPYPGGPQISKLAEEMRGKEKQLFRGLRRATGPRTEPIFQQKNGDPERISFSLPRPMLHSKNFDFSFSGLKTAVLYLIKKINPEGKLDDKTKSKIAFEFENAAIECLTYKTKKAIEKYNIKTLIIAGGVAQNQHLQREMRKIVRQGLTQKNKIKILFPSDGLSGDNSIMIGIAGYLNYIKNKKKVPKPENIKATGNLRL